MTPLQKRLAAWLAEGRRLGAELLPCEARIIGIILFDQDAPKNAIEFRGSEAGHIEQQSVTLREDSAPLRLTASDLSNAKPDPLPRIHVRPAEGLPLIEPAVLSQQEADILEAIDAERGRLQGPEIGERIGRKCDAAMRRLLSRMRKRGKLLDWSGGEGYGITLRGRLSLSAWRDNSLLPGA